MMSQALLYGNSVVAYITFILILNKFRTSWAITAFKIPYGRGFKLFMKSNAKALKIYLGVEIRITYKTF